jgi:hypothetical protein
MRKQSLWMLVLVVAGFLFLAGWTSGANPSAKVTWEYQVISVYGTSTTNPPPNVTQLNNAGREGWELVAIRSGNYPQPDSKQVRTDYYFKR